MLGNYLGQSIGRLQAQVREKADIEGIYKAWNETMVNVEQG